MYLRRTWNRVQRRYRNEFHRQTLSKTLRLSDFPRFVADFSVTLYSRVFFTPYESTRDVKPRPKSAMKVPVWLPIFLVRCRFLRTPCTVGNVSPLMKVLGTWNRVQRVQWKYPLIADFPRSLPISRCPCTVGYFSPLMKVLGTWNRVQRVQ